jgi:mannose-6-phosphate isomerase-like protein (cupin superfamily)
MQVERWKEPYQPNPAMLRFTLSNEGLAVYQWCDTANSMRARHKHDKDQSHWIVSGRLEIRITQSGETYILEAGDRDFIPAETYYELSVVGEEPCLYLVGEKL